MRVPEQVPGASGKACIVGNKGYKNQLTCSIIHESCATIPNTHCGMRVIRRMDHKAYPVEPPRASRIDRGQAQGRNPEAKVLGRRGPPMGHNAQCNRVDINS